MSEDTIVRLFAKVDSISDRLTRLDTRMAERDRREQEINRSLTDVTHRLHELEVGTSKVSGGREMVAWLVTTAIALYGIAQ